MLSLCAGVASYAQDIAPAQPKLSPLTRKYLRELGNHPEGSVPGSYIYRNLAGKEYLTGMIKVDNPSVELTMEQLGVKIGTKAGNIWTVHVPYNKVKEFTTIRGINYIQLDEPLRPAMESATKSCRADSVHKGIGLIWPMTGVNVIMGVIDFGFDYGHPGFFDSTGNNYRVKKAWELNTTGTPPAGYAYGHELNGSAAILAQGTDNAEQMHGTGVAGIAAGSGLGTANRKHKGIAYDADMVFVGVRRDTIGEQWRQSSFSDFVDGINYIFSYATSVSRPAVTNISWGSQSGPHDGTSLFAQACDNLSGQGKVIVMSAGNDGQEKIHLNKTFTPTDTLIHSFATFTSDTMKRTWIDIWGDTAKTFCAQVTLYKNGVAGQTTNFQCIDDNDHSMYILGDNGQDTCYVTFFTTSSEYNNKPRLTIDLYNKSEDSVHIAIKGTDGNIDVWNESYYYGYKYGYSSSFEKLNLPGAVDGSTSSTVSDMGSAKSVLLIGAYVSKRFWTDISGLQWSYNTTTEGIASFSSKGPMADGRIKPDIAAPGMTLTTAMSSFDLRYTPTGLNKQQVVSSVNFNNKNYYYAEFLGTSASAPVASGVVALMLQANPKLTYQQVHSIVKQTAIKDTYTGFTANNTWGEGKLNAFAAVKAAAALNSVAEFNGQKPDCVLFPNPNNGQFTLAYTGTTAQNLDVTVTDAAGRTISTEKWSVTTGDNLKTFNNRQLAGGVYFVKVADAHGSISIKTTIQ